MWRSGASNWIGATSLSRCLYYPLCAFPDNLLLLRPSGVMHTVYINSLFFPEGTNSIESIAWQRPPIRMAGMLNNTIWFRKRICGSWPPLVPGLWNLSTIMNEGKVKELLRHKTWELNTLHAHTHTNTVHLSFWQFVQGQFLRCHRWRG